MRRICLVVIAAQLAACSFAFVHGPPAGQPARAIATKGADPLTCTTSRTVPVLDTVWTALMAINVLVSIGASDKDLPFSRAIAIPLYVVGGAAGGAGMYYGFTRTAACRDAHGELVKAGIELPPELPKPGALSVPTAPL